MNQGSPNKFNPSGKETLLGFLGVMVVIIIVFLATGVTSSFSKLDPEEAAVIINNVTGKTTSRTQPGWIFHLPYGLSDVHKVDKVLISLNMTADKRQGDRPTVDNVRIKSNDGSSVYIDAEISYRIDESQIEKIVKEIGREDAYKKNLVRHYARSLIRDEFGQLSIDELSSPSLRLSKIKDTELALTEAIAPFGLTSQYVSATNFDFNPKFKQMINDRIEADQRARNEMSAQMTASQIQETRIAEATRKKETAVVEERGLQNRRIIEAGGLADKLVKEARGQAIALHTDGDRILKVAEAEAGAIRAEGLAKAAGILKLSEAYSVGGISLVRETLAEKMLGKQINGRPYSLDSHVDRLQLEESGAAARRTRATNRTEGGAN